VTLVSGASLLAFASPGSSVDPLITLSYLTNVFRPQMRTEIQSSANTLAQQFEARVNEVEVQISANPGGPDSTNPDPAAVFHVVTLTNGQTLRCSVGTEIMLRIGTANARGTTAPALVNYTTGMTLNAGTALTTNHMNLVTIEGNGITATANLVRVLVRGTYTVS
jgi:hypothetical protein